MNNGPNPDLLTSLYISAHIAHPHLVLATLKCSKNHHAPHIVKLMQVYIYNTRRALTSSMIFLCKYSMTVIYSVHVSHNIQFVRDFSL